MMEEIVVRALIEGPGFRLRPGFVLEASRTEDGDYQLENGMVIDRALVEPVVSLKVVLEYLERRGIGVVYGTLFKHLQEGAFPNAVKVMSTAGRGGAWRIPVSDLRAYRNVRLAKKGVRRG